MSAKSGLAYKKSHPWAARVFGARARCNYPCHNMWYNYGGKGIRCDLTVKQAWALWVSDEAHLLKKPSIDRIDPKGNYTFANCRFIELEENLARRLEDES